MFEIVFLLFILFNRVEYIFGAVPMIPPNYHDMALHSTVGLMIDAGSGGSRLHIYKWLKEGVLRTVGLVSFFAKLVARRTYVVAKRSGRWFWQKNAGEK